MTPLRIEFYCIFDPITGYGCTGKVVDHGASVTCFAKDELEAMQATLERLYRIMAERRLEKVLKK